MSIFDICVITASNRTQADGFKALLAKRLDHGLYPREVDFRVYPDPPGGRIGSGGSTMWALLCLLADYKTSDAREFFESHNVLIIHAGGESRRLPCYAPEGKLFAPLPVSTSSILPPVTLDMQLSLFFKFPWSKGETLITSGDVILDFDTDVLPEDRGDVCGFANADSFAEGAKHGVYRFDSRQETVVDFYQKEDEAFLAEEARLEGTGQCALDIGIVSLSPAALASLLALSDCALEIGGTVSARLSKGDFYFDIYLELITACLPALSARDYSRRLHGRSKLAQRDLAIFFNALHPFTLKGILTHSSTFLHFGSLEEFPKACLEIQDKGIEPFYAQKYAELQQQCSPELILYNSSDFSVPVRESTSVFAENIQECSLLNAEGNNIFVGLQSWNSSLTIPDGICIEERRLDEEAFWVVYGKHFRRY